MKIKSIFSYTLLLSFLVLVQCVQSPPMKEIPLRAKSVVPSRLLFLVFDQMRPDFIERFDLKNFKRLMKTGLSFPNAQVGHLASVTVMSHPVMATGLYPKHLPWQDEILKDVWGRLGQKNLFYDTLDFELEQMQKLLKQTESTALIPRLKRKLLKTEKKDKKEFKVARTTYTIGQKPYAVYGFGAPSTDPLITLGPKLKEGEMKGYRGPVGHQVPSFILNPFGNRFFIDSIPTYGSENTLYPYDGNRFAPGGNKDHLGGDAWVRDGVLKIFEEDKEWGAIFATFGSIDKVLHVLAEHDSPTTEAWAKENRITLKETLERADNCLGEILSALEDKNILDETLILLTADHGGQPNTHFHGITEAGKGLNYVLYGNMENSKALEAPKSLEPVMKTGFIEAMVHDSALRFWTKSLTKKQKVHFANQIQNLPGVAEVYSLEKTGPDVMHDYHYIRIHRSPLLKNRSLEWANKHHANLMNSIATVGAPDFVALLLDRHGYGFKGEHGGAQEEVQRVPLIIYSPNIRMEKRGLEILTEAKHVDINPFITRLMKLEMPANLDGGYQAIEPMLVD